MKIQIPKQKCDYITVTSLRAQYGTVMFLIEDGKTVIFKAFWTPQIAERIARTLLEEANRVRQQ